MLGLPLPWGRIGHAVADPALELTVAGVPLANPIGLASGFDKACERFGPLGRLGFGYVVGGTVTWAARPGNAQPRIARDPSRRALVNAMGLPNPGAAAAAASLARQPRTTSRWVSLADEETADVCAAHDVLAPEVDAFELNASSPNAGWTHRADHVGEVVAALRERADAPLFVKVPPFGTDEERDGVLAMVDRGRAGGRGRDHGDQHGCGDRCTHVDGARRPVRRPAHAADARDRRRGRRVRRAAPSRSMPAAGSSPLRTRARAWARARRRFRSTRG